MRLLRLAAFGALMTGVMIIGCALCLVLWPLPAKRRLLLMRFVNQAAVFGLRHCYDLSHRVEGLENLPPGPCVILSNHQSAWETLAFATIFPPLLYVLKRELFYIPFFGWGMYLLGHIAIDRGRQSQALKKTVKHAKLRLEQGICVAVFPEGTRQPKGTVGEFQVGGAILALHNHVPIVPVVHNAGTFWRRNTLIPDPGIVQVRVGPPIYPEDKNARELNREAREWIRGNQLIINN